jgi:hypothetical protein
LQKKWKFLGQLGGAAHRIILRASARLVQPLAGFTSSRISR